MKLLHQATIGLLLLWLSPLTVGTLVFLGSHDDDVSIMRTMHSPLYEPPTAKQLHKRHWWSHA
jgi:hypothetical protein